MKNIYDYVKEYSGVSFYEKGFNEVDNMVFSFLSYLNLNSEVTLEGAGNYYLKHNNYRDVRRIGIAQKGAYKLLKLIVDSERYKNIMLRERVYKVNDEMQFSAITFDINKKLRYISFEGTDEKISGWKEDFLLASVFPISSHVEAIKYVNKNVKIFGPKVIIGGHSKGGNLALVSSMYMKFFKKFKVVKVYSNDGPGLRLDEFKSRKFRSIRKKYVHIVPNSSIIGVILRNACTKVIESYRRNILCHDMATWEVMDDTLVSSVLEDKSVKFSKSLQKFFEMHSYEELTNTTKKIFKILEDNKIDDTMKLFKITSLVKVGNKFNRMDAETKKMIIELLTYTYKVNIGM